MINLKLPRLPREMARGWGIKLYQIFNSYFPRPFHSATLGEIISSPHTPFPQRSLPVNEHLIAGICSWLPLPSRPLLSMIDQDCMNITYCLVLSTQPNSPNSRKSWTGSELNRKCRLFTIKPLGFVLALDQL